MCEARGLPVTRIGVVDQGSRCHRGAGPVHGVTGGPAQHVGGRAARVVRVSVPTHDITGEPVAASHERKQRHPLLVWAWSLVRLDFVGIAFGALFFCLSLTPSLLPRDWLFQGLIGGLNAAIGYGIGVFTQKMVRRFVLRRRRWWPPSKRVLYWCKAATITLSTAASLLMLIPAAAWQRRVSAEMGMEGPDTVGYLRTLIIAMLVTGLCVSAARVDHRPHQDDGPVLHPPLASARRGGSVHRHRDRRRAGHHIDQRRADPRFPGRRQPGVPAAEHHHKGGCHPTAGSRTVWQPNVVRSVGDVGVSKAATSSPPARTPSR